MNTLKIGIASRDAFRKRTLAIAKGEYKPGKNDPKVWFESLESLAQLLSGQRYTRPTGSMRVAFTT